MGSELISGLDQDVAAPETDEPGGFEALTTATIPVKVFRLADCAVREELPPMDSQPSLATATKPVTMRYSVLNKSQQS